MEGRIRWPACTCMPRRIPREEVGATDPGDTGALKESQVHEGQAVRRHDDTRNTSKVRSVTSKTMEGEGKVKRPTTRPSGGARRHSQEGLRLMCPEGQVNSTRASVQTET
jgi:hypothetical protein